MKLRSIRGQATGGGAATLVVLIAALILLYILFLPPDVREELLEGDDYSSSSDSSSSSTRNKDDVVLFSESPGRLDFLEEKEVEHSLPEVRLFITTSGNKLFEHNSVYLKKSWFNEQTSTHVFDVKDLENIENAQLTFNAPTREGRIMIFLNGNSIFANEVDSYNIDPIQISKRFLVEGQNTLEFKVESQTWKFWDFDEVVLEGLQITADYTDLSSRSASNSFRVSEEEFENLERARMRFFVDCFDGEPGVLKGYMNDNRFFSAVPECDATSPPIDVTDYLDKGRNSVRWELDRGSVSIFSAQIKSQLEEPINPVFYFELEDEHFDDVKLSDVNLTLEARFIDNREWKNAKVIVNGQTISMTTRDETFSKNIDEFVFRETNAIEVIPEDTLDIVRLQLTIRYP